MTELDFRGLVETAPDIIAVFDRDHQRVYVNGALERAVGRADVRFVSDALIDDVLRDGVQRTTECTIETPRGARQFASIVSAAPDGRVCVLTRDISDVKSARLLDVAVRTMPMGLCVVDAEAGRVLFVNEESDRIFGRRTRIDTFEDYAALRAWGRDGKQLALEDWPLSRACAGEVVVGAELTIDRGPGLRAVRINASPVRDAAGAVIAAVATYYDITGIHRANEAAAVLAEAGEVLARFEGASSLEQIAQLVVPRLADWCMIHLRHGDDVETAAVVHADPVRTAAARARLEDLSTIPPDTAIGRALDGAGPQLLPAITDDMLEDVARDEEHLCRMRSAGYKSGIVAPLAGRMGVLGAITFMTSDTSRTYTEADLALLTEIARRTAIAMENLRLFEAEQIARQRSQRLQTLTAQLSGALAKDDVAAIMVRAGREALGAAAGYVWLLEDDHLVLTARDSLSRLSIEAFARIPLSTDIPVCNALREGRPLTFDSRAALTRAYAGATVPSDFNGWAVIPLIVGGKAIGSTSFSFEGERALTADDRELLDAIMGQTSLALERCLLLEGERRARADAEQARLRERRLGQIAALLASAVTPAAVATIVCEQVLDVLGAVGSLAAVRQGDWLEIVGAAGVIHSATRERFARMPVSTRTAMAEAVARNEIVWVPDLATLEREYPHLVETVHTHGGRSAGAVPLLLEGRPVGSLSFSRAVAGPLTEDQIEFLGAVGQLAGQALERARLYDALQHSYDAASEASRRKDEFLAMLGHELRNPLAPITMALELMRVRGGSSDRERGVIERQVQQLSRLIDDLLDVSRVTRGKIQLAKEVVEASTLVAKAVEMVTPLLERRRHKLVVDVPTSGLALNVDITRITQVIQNVLTNAAKYTEAGGEIQVRAALEADDVAITVRDSGIGIAPELLPNLFDLFVQGERSLDRAEGGLGIGLTIAKTLCDLHGGSLGVASEGVNRGSTFTIRLPHAPQPAAAPEPVPSLLRAGGPMRVLVVDDNLDAAETLHALLRHLGHELAMAHDGERAIEIAREFRPDVALLDIGLPVVDGYEVARRLRKEIGAKVRLIAITGYGQESDRTRTREAGFDHHLVKPIAFDDLATLLADEDLS
jgi:signal transduction histidine kinase/PAS domain-containing protein